MGDSECHVGGGQDKDAAHEFGWEDSQKCGQHRYCADDEDTFSDGDWEFAVRLFHDLVENCAGVNANGANCTELVADVQTGRHPRCTIVILTENSFFKGYFGRFGLSCDQLNTALVNKTLVVSIYGLLVALVDVLASGDVINLGKELECLRVTISLDQEIERLILPFEGNHKELPNDEKQGECISYAPHLVIHVVYFICGKCDTSDESG